MMYKFKMAIVRHPSPYISDYLDHLVIIAMMIMIARVMIDLTIIIVRMEGVVKHMRSVFLLKKRISLMLRRIRIMEPDPDLDIRTSSCWPIEGEEELLQEWHTHCKCFGSFS